MLIYSYINTSGKWEIVWKHDAWRAASVLFSSRVFPISTNVDITVYQYGKNVLYLFYNIAQRNIKKEIFLCVRVDIELYQHCSYSHSAFRIYKCYIILKHSLIIHEENTKKNHKRVVSVYVIQIHVDLHKL